MVTGMPGGSSSTTSLPVARWQQNYELAVPDGSSTPSLPITRWQ